MNMMSNMTEQAAALYRKSDLLGCFELLMSAPHRFDAAIETAAVALYLTATGTSEDGRQFVITMRGLREMFGPPDSLR
jgi:hypothetical protein